MINIEKVKPTGLFTNYIYKAIPLAFDESMSYYETLCGLLSYLKDTVIPALNNNADAIVEVQALMTQLQNYVDNYFDNLDVQEEINTKLDEMAESGVLEEIMADYLDTRAVFGFDSVADMKLATNLTNGSFAKTLGYSNKNDGDGAMYKIRTITNEDIVNEINIIALADVTLIAELIIEKEEKYFNTVADLKTSKSIWNGSCVKTLGYYSANDGEGAEYKIRLKTNEDIVNEINIIALADITLIAELIIENEEKCFNTVADMKTSISIWNGSFVKTIGYYSANDGGDAKYKIRLKTNDDVVDEGSIIAVGTTLVAELINDGEINVKQFGAYGDNTHNDTNSIQNAINYMKNGGIINFPKGTYLTNGNHVIEYDKELIIKGYGLNATHIKFINNENTFCFWFKFYDSSTVASLNPITLSDLRIDDENNTTNSLIKISDRWGCKLKNILSFGNINSTFCELYNNIAWTEGTIIENCMIRTFLNGIVTNKNTENDSATDSFFNTKIIHSSFNLNVNGAKAINLRYFENENHPLSEYDWDIDITVWFGETGGGKNIIAIGDYNYLSGNCKIDQDGTGGIYNGNDLQTIRCTDNGLCNLKGTINYQQPYNVNQNNIKFKQLLSQVTAYRSSDYYEPLIYFKGAKIQCKGTLTPEQSETVIYSSDILPPFSAFLLTVTIQDRSNTYILKTRTVNHVISFQKIDNSVDNTKLILRTKDNETQNTWVANKGCAFELYLNTIDSDLNYNFELEML